MRLGRDYCGTVEVGDGLIEGTSVVLNPNADLVDGTRVHIVARADGGAARAGTTK